MEHELTYFEFFFTQISDFFEIVENLLISRKPPPRSDERKTWALMKKPF